MTLFFSTAAKNLSVVAQLAARTVRLVATADITAMREILNDFEIPGHRHKEAFRQLIVGCALGGGLIDEAKALKVEEGLGDLAVTQIERKRAAKIIAKSLFRQILAMQHNEKLVIAVATELLGLAAESMKKG